MKREGEKKSLIKHDELLEMITRIATSIVNTEPDRLDTAISKMLGEIGSYIGVDRVYLFRHDYDRRVTINTHEWCAAGIKPEIDNLQALSFDIFSEMLEKQMAGEIIHVSSVSDMPKSDPMRELFENEDIQSLILLPTMDGNKCLGFVGFDAVRDKREFVESEINLLKILAELLTNAELRRRSYHELQETRDEIAYRNKLAKALFKNSTDAIIYFDSSNRIVDVNNNFLELFGYTFEEIKGMDIDEIIDRGKLESTNRNYTKSVLSGKTVIAEGTRYNKQGQPIELTIKGIPVLIDNELHGGYTIYTDITKQKQAEEALIKSEEKYREILATMEEGYYEVDLKGNLIFCNDSLCDIIGYSRSELIKLSYKDYYKNPDEVVNTYNRVYQTGISEKAAGWSIVTGDGSTKHIEISVALLRDDQGKAIGFRGVGRDITERKEAEDALRESEDKYREILASIEDGFFEVNLKGNITFCNEASARMLGYTVEEFMGMNYRSFCKNHELVFDAFNRAFLSGETQHAMTFEMIKKDRSDTYGELSLSLVKDKDGNLIGFRGVGRDVTERKQYEDQLKYLSLHDQLTGLYNRVYFENELERLSSSREFPVTIISIDLDGLKLVNDTVGHEQGDRLLIACAQALREVFRGSDVLARVGGDEFVALLPQTGAHTGEVIAGRIESHIDDYNSKNKNQLPLSISLGMATAENNSKLLQDTYKEADDLMYRAKLHKGVDARSQIIQSLMAALGERDFITEGHARRLEELCCKVGEKVNLTKKQLSDLSLLSQVHDLGKVGIPDSILFKEGSLTDEEWDIMKQHSEKGYRIASSSNDLSGIAEFILKHHERWDGSGYPLGLKGEDIPIECRILAIVDAYDAMTNDRPYREAIDKKLAIKELEINAGNQFDPFLVNIFLMVIR